MLKVLLGHNSYQWPGGEDTAFELDAQILEERGHAVARYHRHNDEIGDPGPVAAARTVGRSIWSIRTQRELRDLLAAERPDVAHFQNTFPLVSPSAFAACHRAGVPVVITVQNYRLACPSAFLFRDGELCEDCLHRTVKWPGVLHACYRDSRAQTAAVATMLAAHRVSGAWARHIDVVIAVSRFGRDKLVEAGVPEDRVVVRPNFTAPDPGRRLAGEHGDHVLFAGRLSAEKGVDVVLDAAALAPEVPIRIVGDGPERPALEEQARRLRLQNVEFAGLRPRPEVQQLMRGARVLVFPSRWYEHFPFVLVEAFASGLPAIASDVGAMPEIVAANGAGALFRPGDAADLADRLRWAWSHPAEVAAMGAAARTAFEERYSADRAYENLIAAYDRAIDRHASRARARR